MPRTVPLLENSTVSPSSPSVTVAVRVEVCPGTGSGSTARVVDVTWTGATTLTITCPDWEAATVVEPA